MDKTNKIMRKTKLFKQAWLLATFTTFFVILGSIIFINQPIAAAKEPDLPKQYVGVWEGVGTQGNGVGWSILIALTPGPKDSIVGTIAYPSIPCNGKLLFQEKERDEIKLSEDLTHTGVCAVGGPISLSPTTDNKLTYQWFHPDGRADGEGLLDRISSD
ncbi:MAG: hypothetical protein AAF889_00340 [Cyanobacteria bacterium P01_D01_bin.73]